MALKPTLKLLLLPETLSTMTNATQAWAAAGSNGGFGLPVTVVFRSRYSQPKGNGTGTSAPLIGVRWASAGDRVIPCCCGRGGDGNGSPIAICSVSAEASNRPCPTRNHDGRPVG